MPTRRTVTPFVVPLHLPVLTSDNRSTHPQWHAYVNRVYSASVLQPCDLNMFTWFYRTAPFVSALGPTTNAPLRTWRPGIQLVEREAFVLPGMHLAIGFFVYRPHLTPTWTPNDARFEGMPIRRVLSTVAHKDHLAAVLWHARGTGRWFDRQDRGVHRTARVPLATYALPAKTENDTVAERPLRRVKVERDDKGGIVFTPVDDDTRWSTSQQWTTGLTRRQKIRHDRPPVWFTETEIKMVTLLQTGTDQEVRRYLESLSSEEAHALLNTWLPVQEWPASSEGTFSPLAHGLHAEHGRHRLTTPLGLAAAMGRAYVTQLFVQQGADLRAKCPAWCAPTGHSLDVAAWLNARTLSCGVQQVLRCAQRRSMRRTSDKGARTVRKRDGGSRTSGRRPSKRQKNTSVYSRSFHHRASVQRWTPEDTKLRQLAEKLYTYKRIQSNACDVQCECPLLVQWPSVRVTTANIRTEETFAAHHPSRRAVASLYLQTARLKSILDPWENPDYTVFGETTWYPTRDCGEMYADTDINQISHFNMDVRYYETYSAHLYQCLNIRESPHVLRYRRLQRRVPEDVITRRMSIHLNTVRECDILYDYVGDETIQYTQYEHLSADAYDYAVSITKQLHVLDTLIVRRYHTYMVLQGIDNQKTAHILLHALVAAQVLRVGGRLVLSVDEHVTQACEQALSLVMGCFRTVRCLRTLLYPSANTGCVFVFEGYRGGGRSTVARLRAFFDQVNACSIHARVTQLYDDEAIVDVAWQRQIRSVFATFDTRYKPVLTFVHDYLHFVVQGRLKALSALGNWVQEQQLRIGHAALRDLFGTESPDPLPPSDPNTEYIFLVDVPGCRMEDVLRRLYPHCDRRRSSLRRQVFSSPRRTIIVESYPYITASMYPRHGLICTYLLPPYERLGHAFKTVVQARRQDREWPVAREMHALGISTLDELFRLPAYQQEALLSNRILCPQTKYVTSAVGTLSPNLLLYNDEMSMMYKLKIMLDLPLKHTDDFGPNLPVTPHTYKPDFHQLADHVCRGIDQIYRDDFRYLNRGNRRWTPYTLHVQRTRHLYVLGPNRAHASVDEVLVREVLPIMYLVHRYGGRAHRTPLTLTLCRKVFKKHAAFDYSSLQTALRTLGVHLVIHHFTNRVHDEYVTLPDWSSNSTNTAVCEELRDAVRTMVQLAPTVRPVQPTIRVVGGDPSQSPTVIGPTTPFLEAVARLHACHKATFAVGAPAAWALFLPPQATVIDETPPREQVGTHLRARTPCDYVEWSRAYQKNV